MQLDFAAPAVREKNKACKPVIGVEITEQEETWDPIRWNLALKSVFSLAAPYISPG